LRIVGLPKHCAWTLFLAGVFLLRGVATATVAPDRRQHATEAYEKAEQLHATLEAHPESKRSKEEYKKVIEAYRDVYRQDPAYSKTPVALAAVAELYREMGRQFSSDSYFLESIKAYRFLMSQYPQNRISREAQFTIGEVYRQDLEDPDAARKAFQVFIDMYPKSNKVTEAKEKLREIDRQAVEKAQAHVPPPPVEKVPEELPAEPPRGERTSESRLAGLRQVTAVRRWVGPNYLRIVIVVDGEAKFDSVRLSNPDRIVINLQNSRLSPELVGKTFPVENGFLQQVRVAQFTLDTARVVLDVEKIEAYSIFSLPNPFRLVIDVQGSAPTQIAKAEKPASAPSDSIRRSDKSHAPATPSTAPTGSVEMAARTEPPTPAKGKAVASPAATPDDNAPAAVGAPLPARSNEDLKEETATGSGSITAIQPAAPMESGSRTLTRALGLKIGRIVIDPGHGGHDTGTIGPTGLEEKEVVLDVGLKLKKLLEKNTGCEVVMTRSDDTFIPLEERTAIANQKSADLFISVHANASTDMSARGIETYYLNFTSNADALEVAARENASSQEAVHQLQDLIKKIAMSEKIEESQDFARQVQREVFTRVTKFSGAQRDRGIKKAPFVVLIGANMPSILAEISFLTNPRDERLLRKSDYREKIAYALYEGILDYLKDLGGVRTAQRVAAEQTSSVARPNF